MLVSHALPFCDPAILFRRFAQEDWATLLDSASPAAGLGRYSIIALRPSVTLLARDGGLWRNGVAIGGDPFSALRAELAARQDERLLPGAPFQGGAVGLFGYELGRHLERAPRRFIAGQTEMAVGIYDIVALFDNQEKSACLYGRGDDAPGRLAALAAEMTSVSAPPGGAPNPAVTLTPEITRASYLDRVRRVIAYIRAGDIYQANFTQRFSADLPRDYDGFALYDRLRAINPAPFAAYLRIDDSETVMTASPERFLRLDAAGHIEARPIKGTRKRDKDPVIDRSLAEELAASVKDRAENLMITDLLRNDMARVARLGSVRVPALCTVEHYATLHHLVSVVEGRLRPGLTAVDLLRATFPGGSITGAPKVRAMEIIDEMEAGPRGAYCGAIGWIGWDGAMDSSIVIRSISLRQGRAIAQAGGAIVADSDPIGEYDEMMAKIAPALRALA